MHTPITVRRWGSIALGSMFAAGTFAVIFWDLRQLSDITPDHLMVGLVLVGTIASGHTFWRELRSWHVLSCIALAALFGWGTFQVVVASTARNVETSIPRVLETLNLNEQRRKMEADISEAKGDLRKATDAATHACANGVVPRCQGASKTRDQADSHYWVLVARLADMKPAQVQNAGLKHAAAVLAILPFTGAPEAIEKNLALLLPFARALFLEVGTIVFFSIGFGTVAQDKRAKATTIEHKPFVTYQLPARLPAPTEEQMVLDALDRAGRPVSNEELASLLSCSEGEASRRVSSMRTVLRKERDGRRVAISRKT